MASLPHLPLIIDNEPYKDPLAAIGTHWSAALNADYCTYTSATPDSARAAAASSWNAFQTWRNTKPIERRNILQKTASLLREHQEALSRIYIEETNCAPLWAGMNIHWAAIHLDEIASRITNVMSGELPQVQEPGIAFAMVHKVPIGPVLSIVPWNAAVFLPCRAIDTPLAVGCTVILKASEQSPRTQHYLVDLFHQAGLPKGVLNVLQCRREDGPAVTETLISHPAIRKVEFIGSAAIGRVIGSLAGKYLKPMLMELGGKSPLIICEDADLEAAARAAVAGGYVHHGQVCISTERLIVRKEVEEKFVTILKAVAAAWEPMGAIGAAGPARTVKLVKQAVSQGAELVFGDGSLQSETMMGPVILRGVPKEAEISDEEAFGPVLALYTVDSDEEAIRVANDTQYGLAAGVYTRDYLRGMKIARQLEVGHALVNNPFGTAHDEATVPVGVAKGSGFGKGQNGNAGLEEFLALRTVTVSEPVPDPGADMNGGHTNNGS